MMKNLLETYKLKCNSHPYVPCHPRLRMARPAPTPVKMSNQHPLIPVLWWFGICMTPPGTLPEKLRHELPASRRLVYDRYTKTYHSPMRGPQRHFISSHPDSDPLSLLNQLKKSPYVSGCMHAIDMHIRHLWFAPSYGGGPVSEGATLRNIVPAKEFLRIAESELGERFLAEFTFEFDTTTLSGKIAFGLLLQTIVNNVPVVSGHTGLSAEQTIDILIRLARAIHIVQNAKHLNFPVPFTNGQKERIEQVMTSFGFSQISKTHDFALLHMMFMSLPGMPRTASQEILMYISNHTDKEIRTAHVLDYFKHFFPASAITQCSVDCIQNGANIFCFGMLPRTDPEDVPDSDSVESAVTTPIMKPTTPEEVPKKIKNGRPRIRSTSVRQLNRRNAGRNAHLVS
jgi:hypothetical protein